MHQSIRNVALGVVVLTSATMLSACVGLIVESADYHEVKIEQTRKAEVLQRFGEPVRREREKDLDVWFYKLSKQGVAGAAVDSTMTMAFLIVAPVSTKTEYADNLRIQFRGDVVVRVEERRAKATGAACGIPSHMFPNGCFSSFGAEEPAADPKQISSAPTPAAPK